MNTERKECCICGDEFTGWGNNPEPFEGKTCCDDCNDRFVVPVRMCLGRGFSDKNLLTLLQTIAELGKAIRQATRDFAATGLNFNENGSPKRTD